jgi:hypothetical protein
MKISSVQACFDVSLTKNPSLTQSLVGVRSSNKRGEERLLGARRHFSEVWGMRE